jgi:hypothetical protein
MHKISTFNTDVGDNENSKSELFASISDIIKEYTEYATIQGLVYLTLPNQTTFGKVIWASIVLLMMTMGIYWSILSYNNWQNNQVLTTIATTAFPVKKIDFPAVTFCSPGVNDVISDAPLLKEYFEFLQSKHGIVINITAYKASTLTNAVLLNNTFF